MLTQQHTTLTGHVVDGHDQPVKEGRVVVFSETRANWNLTASRYMAATQLNQEGQFTAVGLPPGPYFVSAVDYLDLVQGFDLSLLEKLVSRATRVILGDNATIAVEVKLDES